MGINVKLGTIIDSLPSIQELSGYRMTGKASYSAGKLARLCLEAAKDFEAARLKLIEKHEGKLNDAGKEYIFPTADAKAKMEAEFAELRETEETIEVTPVAFEAVDAAVVVIKKPDGTGEVAPAATVGLYSQLHWAISEPKE